MLDDEQAVVVALSKAIESRCRECRELPQAFFGRIIRQAIDEVIDGPRTGRCSIDDLDPPEQSYIGTKVEIILRLELGVPRGAQADARIAGQDVEIKWSRTLQWMIGPENVGKYCLGLGTASGMQTFSVGIFRADAEKLRPGGNRDRKSSLTAVAFKQIRWLVEKEPLPSNFIAMLTEAERKAIFKEDSAQARVRRLVQLKPRVPIPRDAFRTVALDKDDPMRRLRKDKYRPNPLGGMVVLSTKYGREALMRLGFDKSELPPDHWIAIPEDELS